MCPSRRWLTVLTPMTPVFSRKIRSLKTRPAALGARGSGTVTPHTCLAAVEAIFDGFSVGFWFDGPETLAHAGRGRRLPGAAFGAGALSTRAARTGSRP